MASNQNFVDFIVDQISDAGEVQARKMFGEYGVHCNGKFISIIAENQFFLKPTDAGHKFIGEPVKAPPYPGAKDYFLIESNLENREWMTELVRLTAADLPEPAKRKKK